MVKSQDKLNKTQMNASAEDSDHHSAAVIVSNEDLLTEILLRLPVASILRFKSVSKLWRSLLSHTHFALRYYPLSKSPGCFISNVYVPFDVENGGTPSLDFHVDPCGFKIVQSCDGLLLCQSDTPNMADRTYYVVNPTTKQVATIPSVPGGLDVRKHIRFMGLAFHQTECAHYKVVCIRCLKDNEAYQIQIYSSDTGKWKISVQSFSMGRSNFHNGVYWNGAMHWASDWMRNWFYFKIEEVQLQPLPLPAETTSNEKLSKLITYFGESGGHLHLIVSTLDMTNWLDVKCLHLNVYEMLRDHSGWFVKYQLQLDELPTALPETFLVHGYEFSISDVVRGEKEEDTIMVLTIPVARKMITFNFHDKIFKSIFSITDQSQWEVYRYTETLASL